MLHDTIGDLEQDLRAAVVVEDATVRVVDPLLLRSSGIDTLVYNAVFHSDGYVRDYARWMIREAAAGVGALPGSTEGLYLAMGRGLVRNFTTPAVNVRLLTYDFARAFFRAAHDRAAGAFIFEIAKSEMAYCEQEPGEYVAVILAAAVKEGHHGPVFIQGDHFQVNAANFSRDADRELAGMKSLIDHALSAGFFNIDIDASTLVDIAKATEYEQQLPNFMTSAELTAHVRRREPPGVSVSIGGEIGEVGGHNSTVDEFRAFMDGYVRALHERDDKARGISKISVQTGTEHGGIPLPDGRVAEVDIDIYVLKDIGEVARHEYGLGGTVQHGASTLPDELFDRFPQNACNEIHLATGFQNLVLDHPLFPTALKESMYRGVDANAAGDRKPGQSDGQFYYRARKRAIGPFKRPMWDMEQDARDGIMRDVESKLGFYIDKLAAADTASIVHEHCETKRIETARPARKRPASKQTRDYLLSDSGGE